MMLFTKSTRRCILSALLAGVWLIQTADAVRWRDCKSIGGKNRLAIRKMYISELRGAKFALGDYIEDTQKHKVGRVYEVSQVAHNNKSNPQHMMTNIDLIVTKEKYAVQWLYKWGDYPEIFQDFKGRGNRIQRSFPERYVRTSITLDAQEAMCEEIRREYIDTKLRKRSKRSKRSERRLLTLEESHREMRNALRNQC